MYDTRDIIKTLGGHRLYPTTIRCPDGSFHTTLTRNPGSLRYQVEMRLASLFSPGKSKHAVKKHNHGNPAKNYIHMSTTYRVYLRNCLQFVDWIDTPVRTLAQAKKYVPIYLRYLKKIGRRATTIKSKAAALAKLYGCSITDFGAKLPKRHRADRDFSAKNQKVIDFYKKNPRLCLAYLACGLRKNKELAKITCDDFRFNDGTGHIVGKNGRPRRFAVLPGLDYLVEDFVHQAAVEGRRKPFCKIPKDAPVHHLRRMYACLWYLHLARPIGEVPRAERYYCKAELAGLWLDRTALLQVSSWLGHQRPDVTVAYIAPFAERDDSGCFHIIDPLSLLPGAEAYFRF